MKRDKNIFTQIFGADKILKSEAQKEPFLSKQIMDQNCFSFVFVS